MIMSTYFTFFGSLFFKGILLPRRGGLLNFKMDLLFFPFLT
jgi:hypothetical protein